MKSVRTRVRRAESPVNREQSLREKISSLRIVSHELKRPLVERWSFFCWYNIMICPSFFVARRCSNVCEQVMEVLPDRSIISLFILSWIIFEQHVGRWGGEIETFFHGDRNNGSKYPVRCHGSVSSELHTNVV